MSAPTVSAEELARAEDYRHVFATDPGKRVLQDLEQMAGMFSDLLPGEGALDMHRVAASLGARKLYLHIRLQIRRAQTAVLAPPVITSNAWGDPETPEEA